MTVHIEATSGREEGIKKVLLKRQTDVTEMVLIANKADENVTFQFLTKDFFSHLKIILKTHNRVDLPVINGANGDEMHVQYEYKDSSNDNVLDFNYLGFRFQLKVRDLKVIIEELDK